MAQHLLRFTVNREPRAVVAHSHERLLDVLRNRLGLKGAKDGCSTGDCGTCVVLLDGRPVNSCLMLAVQARNRSVETIEGIGTPERLHPLQETFMDFNASQCGYCIPGMIMTAKHLLDHNPAPTVADIRKAIAGVLCRCTGYWKIIEAVEAAGRVQRGA